MAKLAGTKSKLRQFTICKLNDRDFMQGTASGKCGVTFAEQSCGDSVGEHTYNELQNSVKQLSAQASQNSQIVHALESAMFGSYGSYKQTKGSISMAQPPSKIGGITVDETFDFPNEGKGCSALSWKSDSPVLAEDCNISL